MYFLGNFYVNLKIFQDKKLIFKNDGSVEKSKLWLISFNFLIGFAICKATFIILNTQSLGCDLKVKGQFFESFPRES